MRLGRTHPTSRWSAGIATRAEIEIGAGTKREAQQYLRAVEVERRYTGNPLGEIVMQGSRHTLGMDIHKQRDIRLLPRQLPDR
jgi:hypothetical protein